MRNGERPRGATSGRRILQSIQFLRTIQTVRTLCVLVIAASLAIVAEPSPTWAQQQGGGQDEGQQGDQGGSQRGGRGGRSGGGGSQRDDQDIETGTIDDDGRGARGFDTRGSLECPGGSYLNQSGRACVSILTRGLVCPDGLRLVGERCFRDADCADGEVRRDGQCVTRVADDGERRPVTEWDCPPGSEPDGEVCRDLVTGEVRCPGTTILMADGTCAVIFAIPRGEPEDDVEDEPVVDIPPGPGPCLALGGCGPEAEPDPVDPACLALGGCDPDPAPTPTPAAAESAPARACPAGAAEVDGACVLESCPAGLERRDILLETGVAAEACCSIGRDLATACPPGFDQRRRCCVL